MPGRGHGGSTPIPDPTLLTTEQLTRAIEGLKELHGIRFEAMRATLDRHQIQIDEVSPLVSERVSHLGSLHDERFKSIQVQFTERDTRAEQTSKDSKVAVDAALQAAKEAVAEQNRSSALAIAKSETATSKQIDQLGVLINSGTKGLDDKIDDLKSRLTLLEGKSMGGSEVRQDRHATSGVVVGIMGAVVGVIGMLVAIATFALRRGP